MDPEIQDQDWTNVPEENGVYKLEISQDFNGEIFFRAVTGADNRSKVSSVTVRVQKTAPVPLALRLPPPPERTAGTPSSRTMKRYCPHRRSTALL